eukprot:366231-Chlamydomonas_euryale.AAC.4
MSLSGFRKPTISMTLSALSELPGEQKSAAATSPQGAAPYMPNIASAVASEAALYTSGTATAAASMLPLDGKAAAAAAAPPALAACALASHGLAAPALAAGGSDAAADDGAALGRPVGGAAFAPAANALASVATAFVSWHVAAAAPALLQLLLVPQQRCHAPSWRLPGRALRRHSRGQTQPAHDRGRAHASGAPVATHRRAVACRSAAASHQALRWRRTLPDCPALRHAPPHPAAAAALAAAPSPAAAAAALAAALAAAPVPPAPAPAPRRRCATCAPPPCRRRTTARAHPPLRAPTCACALPAHVHGPSRAPACGWEGDTWWETEVVVTTCT